MGEGPRDAGFGRLRQLLEGPLGYAARQPGRVHGLENFLRKNLGNFRSLSAEESPGFAELVSDILTLTEGLDGLAPHRKRDRAERILTLLRDPSARGRDRPRSAEPAPVPGRPAESGNDREPLDPETPIQFIRGVGPARAGILGKLGIETVRDAAFHLPRRYEDRRNIRPISRVRVRTVETVAGEIVAVDIVKTPRKGFQIFRAVIDDGRGRITAKWFNQGYLKKTLVKGTAVILTGLIKPAYRGPGVEIENPEFEVLSDDEPQIHTKRIVPVYPLTEGWTARSMRRLLYQIVEQRDVALPDILPAELRRRHELPEIREAVRNVHFPPASASVEKLNEGTNPWRRRLAFDELFLLELGLARIRSGTLREAAVAFGPDSPRLAKLRETLPFSLTGAQERVIETILRDLATARPMNRLIQGDVGCGKTLVALAAMLVAVDAGWQAALMAPTEVLAVQHYHNIRRLTEPLGIVPVLRTAGRKSDGAPSDTPPLVIGTHALIQESVSFDRLGLVIIDEQHRFGVGQRARLREKGAHPHVLVMTATPIPRTLCLTVYGDLDLSVIDELPPGRTPVTTKVVFPSQREQVYAAVTRELAQGRQAYVVFPLAEESENVDLRSAAEGYEELSARFAPHRTALLHGKMDADEKARVMAGFTSGEIQVLAATTVVEVGVDVPNATVMVVEHAERFGLSQLHQLRGRVGRGTSASSCLLVAYPPLSDDGRRRLAVMEETSDGFRIAEADLEIRGPGEFFGTRQSGMPDLRAANILRDADLLEIARVEAFRIVENDPELASLPAAREELARRWPERLRIVRTG